LQLVQFSLVMPLQVRHDGSHVDAVQVPLTKMSVPLQLVQFVLLPSQVRQGALQSWQVPSNK